MPACAKSGVLQKLSKLSFGRVRDALIRAQDFSRM